MLVYGIIQVLIVFQGTLNSWWTRIVIGFLVFVFCLLQRLFESGKKAARARAFPSSRQGAGRAMSAEAGGQQRVMPTTMSRPAPAGCGIPPKAGSCGTSESEGSSYLRGSTTFSRTPRAARRTSRKGALEISQPRDAPWKGSGSSL